MFLPHTLKLQMVAPVLTLKLRWILFSDERHLKMFLGGHSFMVNKTLGWAKTLAERTMARDTKNKLKMEEERKGRNVAKKGDPYLEFVLCFYPSKCIHTAVSSEQTYTHPQSSEQPFFGALYWRWKRMLVIHLQSLPRLEPATFELQGWLSNHHEWSNLCWRRIMVGYIMRVYLQLCGNLQLR